MRSLNLLGQKVRVCKLMKSTFRFGLVVLEVVADFLLKNNIHKQIQFTK